MSHHFYSIVVPVYNRPDEAAELLESLISQTLQTFEVIIVEDGSQIPCEAVVKKFQSQLDISYFCIPNGGPGQARNYGAARSKGDYVIVLDSDCVLPPDYIQSVTNELNATNADVFGGPDKAAENFTNVQKAINYSMTSFFTTGGIRGGKKKIDKFYPRSFNMGVRKTVYDQLGGFAKMRFGEDIDFSIRLYENGCSVALFSSAWVYHKRRTNWRKFFKQVYNSGIARINLYLKYPKSLKLVHLLPASFTIASILLLIGGIFWYWLFAPLALYGILVLTDSSIKNKNFYIGLLSIISSFVQLFGYGCGFLSATWTRLILKKGEFSAFEKNFYK